MRTNHVETDYLIIGAGAVGLAFADTLLSETDAHITIVDRRGKPNQVTYIISTTSFIELCFAPADDKQSENNVF